MSFEPKLTNSLSKKSILIVEDDEILAMHLVDNLSKTGYEVYEPVFTAKNAVDKIKADPPTVKLMDIELGKEKKEIEAIEEISRISDIPIIFIAGFLEENLQNKAKIAASYGYLVKPVLERELTETIERALYKHKIDQQMKVSETRYRLLFEEMVEAFALHEVVLDQHGKPIDYIFLDVNPAFERLTGLKKENIINKRVLEILPTTESYWIETYGNVALTEEDINFENYSVEMDRWYTVVAFSPKKGQFATIFMDITDRKKAEETLQESEERFRKVFSEHDVPMLLIDPKDNSIVDANSGAANYYGYPIEKLCTMTFGDINTLSSEEMDKIIDRKYEEKNKYLVFPNRLANGEIRIVEIYTTPIVINKNLVIYSIIHDITERTEAEKKLENQLDELRRWHDVTLGREHRIIELKREVNQLLKIHGMPSKYNSVEEK